MGNKQPQRIIIFMMGCLFSFAAWANPLVVPNAAASQQEINDQTVDDLELSDDEDNEPIFAEVPVTQIRNFIEIFDMVKGNYVAAVTDDELFGNALHGLVENLDPYSRYLSAEQYQKLMEFTEGEIAKPEFSVHFNNIKEVWELAEVVDRSHPYQQGLRNGTIVEKINDVRLKNLDQRAVQQLLNGSLGSLLRVEVKTEDKTKIIEVTRDQKISYAVEPYLTNDQILVVKIKAFQQDTTQQVQDILNFYQQQTQLKGLLIDIRDNPGGLLAAAVDLADLFLEQGLIVSTRGRIEAAQRFQALSGAVFHQNPIGILQDRYSASAAEVFAAAMKEQGRAYILGERSYGKGAVQKLFPLKQGALQLTVSYYYTPQGQLIEGKGIEPHANLLINTNTNDAQVLQQALDTFHSYILSYPEK